MIENFPANIPSLEMSTAQIYDMLQRQVRAEGGNCGEGLSGGRRIGGSMRGGVSAEGGIFSTQSKMALQEYARFRSAHKGVGREQMKALWAAHKRNNGMGSSRPVIEYSADDVYEFEGGALGYQPKGGALGSHPRGGLLLGAPPVSGGFIGQAAVFAKIKRDNPHASKEYLAQLRAQARLEHAAANAAVEAVPHERKAMNSEWREAVVRRAKDSCREARQIAEGKDPYHHMAAAARKAAAHAVITHPVAEAHPEVAQQLLSDLADQQYDELLASYEAPAAPRKVKKKSMRQR